MSPEERRAALGLCLLGKVAGGLMRGMGQQAVTLSMRHA